MSALLLDAALSYAAQGRRVFPLQWAVDGKCSCQREDCGSPAKHPRTEHGLTDATVNEVKIRAWWGEHPQANIGMVMGAGLLAIDVDPRKGGDESVANLGELPDTVTALTGGGGSHLIYHVDEDFGNGIGIAPGIDVRSAGGYLCVPPSLHVSGHRYEWEVGCAPGDLKPAPLPEAFKRLMQNGQRAPEVGEIIPSGERNGTLASIAGTMRRRGLEEGEIAAALLEVNANRCNPPLPDHEVRRIAASVARYPAPAKASTIGTSEADTPVLSGPVLVQLSRVQREKVRWLWQDRIPLGRLTGIVGDPGVGKSWLTLAVASAVTAGVSLPGQEAPSEPGNMLLLTSEDGLADTVRPRMEDMGADLERVTVLTAVRDAKGNERHPSLLMDIPAMESVLADGGYSLVIIDPLNAYLGVNLDTHRDAALRSALTPLAAMAERWGVAVLFVHHLNKGQRDRAIYRLQGSIAVVAAARVVHLVGINPDDATDRIFANIKNNLALPPSALAFELKEGRFLWRGPSTVTEAALLRADEDEEASSAHDGAVDFLRIVLAGGAVEVKQIRREAHDAGVSDRTLDRAKYSLGVKAERQGKPGEQGAGAWSWALPNVKNATRHVQGVVAHLTPSDREQSHSTSAIGALNPDPDFCLTCGAEATYYAPNGKPFCDEHRLNRSWDED